MKGKKLAEELKQAEVIVSRMEYGDGAEDLINGVDGGFSDTNGDPSDTTENATDDVSQDLVQTTTPSSSKMKISNDRLRALESSNKYIQEINELKQSMLTLQKTEQEQEAVFRSIEKNLRHELLECADERNDLREQLLITSRLCNEKMNDLRKDMEMQKERHVNEDKMSTMRMEAKEAQICALEEEMVCIRRSSKHMESAAIMAQSEFMILNQQFYDIAELSNTSTIDTSTSKGNLNSRNNITSTPIDTRRQFKPTTPASAYLKKNMQGTGSAHLNRAMYGVALLRSELDASKKKNETSKKLIENTKSELNRVQIEHSELQQSCYQLTEELTCSKDEIHALKEASKENASLTAARQSPRKSSRKLKSPRRRALHNSPRNQKKTPVDVTEAISPYRSPHYPPRHTSGNTSTTETQGSARSISSIATTVGANSTPVESTTSSGSSNDSSSFTPYSAYTPLSVKISRFAAQMSGSVDVSSDMDEMIVLASSSVETKRVKRSINSQLDKEIKSIDTKGH